VNLLFTVAVLIVVLGVLIFVHELGHFLAAKWAGIRVHRFALGMGNPIPGLSFRRGDTEYAICWLPLGGYVKMATREEEVSSSALEGARVEEPVPPDQVFEAKPVWKRMIVILAGVAMNVLFAYLVFTWLAAKNGEQLEPTTTVGLVVTDSLPPGAEALKQLKPGDRIVMVGPDSVQSWNDVESGIASVSGDSVGITLADGRVLSLHIHQAALADRLHASLALQPFRPAILGTVIAGRPADRAGLKVMDTILAINGEPITQWYDLVTRVRASGGRPITFKIARGEELEITLLPETESETVRKGVTERVGKIGAGPYIHVTTRPYTIGAAFGAGARATLAASTQIIRTVQGLISARISSREVGGPILIGQMAAQSARLGLDTFLSFMALVSVNLAVLNLLPIPVLDGGQFLFLAAEGVLRRPLSLRLRERLTLVGLFLIVCLMVLAFSNDIRRLLGV
jgi:regulator of sigma E protease